MTSQEYWKKREESNYRKNIKNEKEYRKHIEEIYKDMFSEIQKEIEGFYARYARKEGITIADAKKKVAKVDMSARRRNTSKKRTSQNRLMQRCVYTT